MIDIEALGLSEEEKVQVAMLAGHERAKRSFERFVAYVKISESGEGMVPLLEWDHLSLCPLIQRLLKLSIRC